MAVADEPEAWPVARSRAKFEGSVVGLRVDTLDVDGHTFDREVVTHPGAVAVLAINDRDDVLILAQYRHAAGRRMVELPAGLLDVDGEAPLEAAKRELREEGGVKAARWQHLLDYVPSPGISTERVHVYLARDLDHADQADGFEAEHEEAAMSRGWVAFDDLVAAVLDGAVQNGITVVAALAVNAMRRGQAPSAME